MKEKRIQSIFLSMRICIERAKKYQMTKYILGESKSQDLTQQKLVLYQYFLIDSPMKFYLKMMRTIFRNRKSSNFYQQQHIRSSDLKNQLFFRQLCLRQRIAPKSARRATKMKQRRRVLRTNDFGSRFGKVRK